MEKSFSSRDVAVVIELLRRDIFHDRQMFRSWAQILAHRQDLAADFAQIVHGLKKFRLLLAKAEHDTTLGHHTWRQMLCAP